MKILLLDKEEPLKVSGAAIFNERLYRYLISMGHDVYIVRFAKHPHNRRHISEIPYYIAEKRSYIFVPSEQTLAIFAAKLKTFKPDIVYTQAGLTPLDFFLPGICHKLHIPIASVWHMDLNDKPSAYKWLLSTAFLTYTPFCQQLDMAHVFSDHLKNFFSGHGVNPHRIHVIPNGVNTAFYTPGRSKFADTHAIQTGILFLGRLTFQKNPEVLIKSFLAVNPPPGTKLVLAGFGELEKPLRKKYRDPRIIFTGVIRNEEQKRDIIRGCQIFVLPSRYEGMSLALLEAMSSGLACVVSDVGDNTQILRDAGVIIPFEKLPLRLPVALSRLLASPIKTSQLGKKARAITIRYHNEQKIVKKILTAFTRTVADFSSRHKPVVAPPKVDKVILDNLTLLWKKAKQLRIDLGQYDF